MRNLATAALLVGGAILASQSAFSQTYGPIYESYPNDLIFGFQNQAGGGTEDYMINLGSAASVVGKSTVLDLSSDFSLTDFNAVQGGSPTVQGGVVGASNAGNPSDVYVTQLRSSGVGNPAVAGSSVTATLSKSGDNLTYSQMGTLDTPAVGAGTLDTAKTWESLIDSGSGTSSFETDTGLDPDSPVSSTNVLYEDLWETASSSGTGQKPFTYLGYFTLDLTGSSPKLTFTSTNVPASLSPPTIVSVSRSGSTVTVVSSNAVQTHSYQLQYTTSLTGAISWSTVAGSSVLASTTMVTNLDSTATSALRFYRVEGQ